MAQSEEQGTKTTAAAEAAAAGGSPGPEGGAPAPGDPGASGSGLDLVLDVPLRLTVEIGGTQLYVREVLQLDKGSVVELDRMSGEPADVLVNGRVVARGEVTVVDDRLAVRLVQLVGADGPARGSS